jgi:hypothetical protein
MDIPSASGAGENPAARGESLRSRNIDTERRKYGTRTYERKRGLAVTHNTNRPATGGDGDYFPSGARTPIHVSRTWW